MSTRAVTFDLDGTLYDHARARGPMVWRNLHRMRALRVGKQVREELRAQAFPSGAALLDEEARVTAERLDVTPDEARALLDAVYRTSLCAVLAKIRDARVREALEKLAARVKIAVVSDRVVDEKLVALGLDALPWAAKVSGDETGALKPAPRPFLLACEAMGVAPADAVHVGDRDDMDGAGARAAGLGFFLVAGPADLPRVVDEILAGT